jgi:hypothetical protein
VVKTGERAVECVTGYVLGDLPVAHSANYEGVDALEVLLVEIGEMRGISLRVLHEKALAARRAILSWMPGASSRIGLDAGSAGFAFAGRHRRSLLE